MSMGDMFNVPHVLSSETVEGLTALMLETNLKTKLENKFYSIVHDGRRFHAFYYKVSDDSQLLAKIKPKKAKG
jgi:hypothetical protein